MMNFGNMFQAAISVIESLTDNHKTPLHVGEVMACWTYLAFVSNIITYEEVGLNSVTDPEIKAFITNSKEVAESHKEQLSKFMANETIPLPSIPKDKPEVDPTTVSLGAKFTEDEILNTLVVNFVFAADSCAASASQCLRVDVGLMFLNFQIDKLALGYKAKDIMKRKGWLKVPPYYNPL
jgi:hypothetical protein